MVTRQAGDGIAQGRWATRPRRARWRTCSATASRWCERNYRVARGPRARGGEIDLILRERDGTLVFVEVRARAQR